MTSSGNPISKHNHLFDVATSYSRITLTASRGNMRHFGQPGFCDRKPKQCTKDSVEVTEQDKLLADLRVQRVVSLLGQYGLRPDVIARLLRRLAEWYQPSDRRVCEGCGELFKSRRRSARYCSRACKQSAYRDRKRNAA